MSMDKKIPEFTAKCRTVRGNSCFYLTFFCEACGRGYSPPPLVCNTPNEALHLGEQDARLHFNRCRSCHRWVCDEHFNENGMMCTDCMPRICIQCGFMASKNEQFCTMCGTPLF